MVTCSLKRLSSNAGQTYFTLPFAGMMATIVRSLGHQCTPVKYSNEVPQSSTNAPILFFASNSCALLIRDSLSATEIGSASVARLFKICFGAVVFDGERNPKRLCAVTASAPIFKKSFRFIFIKIN
jgi:hypothetical protein